MLYSFKTVEEFHEVKADMEKSFEEYSMPLKYLITSAKLDPNVINHLKRGDTRVEKTLGIL